jgi:hypothetical protein
MLSARDEYHAATYPDTVVERRTAAAIDRAETRLRALRQAYESQSSRIRNELMLEIKSIESGWLR